jgi:hypothetical protein
MHKSLLLLSLSLLLVAACAGHGNYEGYYFTYDAVDVRAFPSDTSKVVLKLVCDRRPGSYKEKEGEIPYAFVTDNMEPVPIGVKKMDESGKWGYIDESVPMVFHWKGWIPLDKMIYCGGQDKTVEEATYEVKEDNLVMYKHPVVNDKEKLVHKLNKGDKVQIRATEKDWSFVCWLRYTDTGGESQKYGWVKTKTLAQVEAASKEALQEEAYDRLEEKSIAKAGSGGKVTEWGIKHGIKLRSVFQKVDLAGAILALLFALAFAIPAIKHKRWMTAIIILPVCAITLFLFSYLTSAPSIVYALLVVVLAYAVLYPMLYTKLSETFLTAFKIVSIAGGLYMLVIFELLSGGTMVWHILKFVIYAAILIWLTLYIAGRIADNICPHCGYYAGHPKIQTLYEGSTESSHDGTEDIYKGKTVHMEGNTEVTTHHYERRGFTDTMTTRHYRTVRRCMNCGHEFDNYKSKSSTKRKYH